MPDPAVSPEPAEQPAGEKEITDEVVSFEPMEQEAGEPADLTVKKVLRALRPSELGAAVSACMDAMNEGMRSEIPEKEKEGPVEGVLEEIEKKKEADG